MILKILQKIFTDKFEIFVLILLTLGPINTPQRMVIYALLIFLNVNRIKEVLTLNRTKQIILFIVMIPLILDICNIDAKTPYSLAGLYYLFPFFVCNLWNQKYKYEDFKGVFLQVSLFCCICSLAGIFIVYNMPKIIEYFPAIYYNGREVKSVLFFNAIRESGGTGAILRRNCGIAFEPGAFQFIPNLSIAFILGEKKRIKYIDYLKLFVYISTVLTTKSTTGIGILGILLILHLFSVKHIIIGAVLLISARSVLLNSIEIQINKLASGNLYSRFGRSIYAIKNYLFCFFGIGSTGYNKIYRVNNQIGAWDTYTNLFLRFGFLFLILFIYFNIRLKKLSKEVMLVVLLTFLTESLIGPITVMLFYYCEKEYMEQRCRRKRGLYGNKGFMDLQRTNR